MPKLYEQLAAWWPLLSSPADYADEAAFFRQVLFDAGLPGSPTMLELGSGGGNNAFHLKKDFHVTLTDLSPFMLSVSRTLNPDCQHIQGDVRTLRLGRLFDTVFIHDAIMYMTTREDLQRALETAWIHCNPGGNALFVPDFVRETFRPATKHGGTDGADRGLRYLEWTYDPNEDDTTVITDFAFLLREGKESVMVEYDRHINGIFPRGEWLRMLNDVGFEPRMVRDSYGRDLFIAHRPSS